MTEHIMMEERTTDNANNHCLPHKSYMHTATSSVCQQTKNVKTCETCNAIRTYKQHGGRPGKSLNVYHGLVQLIEIPNVDIHENITKRWDEANRVSILVDMTID